MKKLSRECCDLLEAQSEQMSAYHATNLATVILQVHWLTSSPFFFVAASNILCGFSIKNFADFYALNIKWF